MARLTRVVAVGVPHHITQRGNQRRDVFLNDQQRRVYLDLLAEHCPRNRLRVQAYCLMSNHLHIVGIPEREDSLATTLRNVHGRFAQFWNTVAQQVGHMWQNRFYSCPVEPQAAWRVIRYVELNPVRAGMVRVAGEYRWSSAGAHTGGRSLTLLDTSDWAWTPREWAEVLADTDGPDCQAIRQATYAGRPWGSTEFVKNLERQLGRNLVPSKGGRPKKVASGALMQSSLW